MAIKHFLKNLWNSQPIERKDFSFGGYVNTFEDLAGSNKARIDFNTLYTIYNNVVDVKQAIKVKQGACVRDGYRIVNINDPDGTPDIAQTKAAMEILESARGFTTRKDIWVRDQDVAGNHFWYIQKDKAGKVIGLPEIDPRTMSIVADQFGNIKKYVQRVHGSDVNYFEPEEIIHSVMDYSTSKPLLGTSPIEAIVWEAKTDMSAQMSQFYFYENNAVPSHLLIANDNLTKDQMVDLKESIDEKFKGTANRFKSGIIPGIKDVKNISPSQKDQEFIQSRKFTTKKIVVAFGVDSFILGYTEGVQRNNAQLIYKNFYENTVRAYEVYLEEQINVLFDRMGLDRIRFEINESNYDDAKELEDRTRADVLSGIVTINEARQVRGLEPIVNPLADELLYQGRVLDDLAFEENLAAEQVTASFEEREKKFKNLLEI